MYTRICAGDADKELYEWNPKGTGTLYTRIDKFVSYLDDDVQREVCIASHPTHDIVLHNFTSHCITLHHTSHYIHQTTHITRTYMYMYIHMCM